MQMVTGALGSFGLSVIVLMVRDCDDHSGDTSIPITKMARKVKLHLDIATVVLLLTTYIAAYVR